MFSVEFNINATLSYEYIRKETSSPFSTFTFLLQCELSLGLDALQGGSQVPGKTARVFRS